MPQELDKRNVASIIDELLDSPQLPALLDELPAQTIAHLLAVTGIESLATNIPVHKLEAVLDIQLWQASPGEQQALDPEQFLPWLESWNEAGSEFVASRLEALGSEFVAVCFARYLSATDTSLVGISQSGHEFGGYDVVPKQAADEGVDEAWFILLETLQHLHAVAPDFLTQVLNRCSFVRSILREDVSEHDMYGHIHQHLEEDRELKAEQAGFVTPTDAFAFLTISRDSDPDEVLESVAYDELSRRYFRPRALRIDAADTPLVMTSQADLSALKQTLGELGISGVPIAGLLSHDRSEAPKTLLDTAMTALAEESGDLFQRRKDETLYLANVLIAGVGLRGTAFSEANAVKAVQATCNLGFEYLIRETGLAREEAHFELLSAEPGLIRPFQLGFSLLNRIPVAAASAIADFLRDSRTHSRLKRVPWIASQLDHLLPGHTFLKKVEERRFEDLKPDIQLLALVLDNVTILCLELLLDPFPVFPRILSMEPTPMRLDRSLRFVRDLEDLARIELCLSTLTVDM